MKDKSDAYRVWLGIPHDDQPPHHYRLLGIQLYESDPAVIDHAATRQSLQLKSVQTGPHARLSQQLLNEVQAARICLHNPAKKTVYDAHLAKRLTTDGQPPLPQIVSDAPPAASPSRTRSTPPSKNKKPTTRPVLETVKIVFGSLAGLFLAVLVLSYFADIDVLGWRTPKKTAVKTDAKNKGPEKPQPTARVEVTKQAEVIPSRLRETSKPVPVAEKVSFPETPHTSGVPASGPPPHVAPKLHVPSIPEEVSDNAAPVEAEQEPPSAELLARMRAMPAPYVVGNWKGDGKELLTEGGPGIETQFCIFGDPQWKDYNLKVDVVLDKPGMMHSVVFLVDDDKRWDLEFGGWDDPRNLDLLPWVEGEDRWQSKARRWKGLTLHGELGKWYATEVQVRGTKVTVLVDGKQIAQSEHSKISQGRVGAGSVGAGRARWRNFEVTTPAGEVLWRGLPTISNGRGLPLADATDIPRSSDPEAEKRAIAVLAKMNRELSAFRLELLAVRKAMLKSFDDTEAKIRGVKNVNSADQLALLERLRTNEGRSTKPDTYRLANPCACLRPPISSSESARKISWGISSISRLVTFSKPKTTRSGGFFSSTATDACDRP